MDFTNQEILDYLVNVPRLAPVDIKFDDINFEHIEMDSEDDFAFVSFNGDEGEPYIRFYKSESCIFLNEGYDIMFIDDDEKNWYGSSDIYHRVVYEGSLKDKTNV